MSSVKFAMDKGAAAPPAGGGGGGGPAPQMLCATCRVKFTTMDELRKHYSCDWHTANVRLRVDGKIPMTQHAFKVQQNNAEYDGGEKLEFSCKICKKHFKSVHTLQAHVKSTEHLLQKEKVILARDSQAGSMLTTTSLGSAAIGLHRRAKAHKSHAKKHADPFKSTNGKVSVEDREADVDELRCIFCGKPSEDIDSNLQHMQKSHSFEIPILHRVKDKKGLLLYLARKVNGLMCLVCNDETRQVPTLAALRDHMLAKDHTYLHLTGEYQEFFEGKLDDDEVVEDKDDGICDKLVVSAEGNKKVIRKKEEAAPIHRHTESSQAVEQRRLIGTQQATASALIKKDRADAVRKETNAYHKNVAKRHNRDHKYIMETSISANKLHAKGYDGNIVMTK